MVNQLKDITMLDGSVYFGVILSTVLRGLMEFVSFEQLNHILYSIVLILTIIGLFFKTVKKYRDWRKKRGNDKAKDSE